MFWYHNEVEVLEKKPVLPKQDKPRVLFYGSSSIRLWPQIETDFPEYDIMNQAFGGSTIAACCWFFKRLIPQYQPDAIVFYAGDNDLGDNRHPEEVYLNFINLMALIKEHCGNIPVGFISIKPSFAREYLQTSIHFTNKIISNEIERNYPHCTFINVYDDMLAINKQSHELFTDDGLHMTAAGYILWTKIITDQFLHKFVTTQIPEDTPTTN